MRETVRAVIVDRNHRTFLVQHRERNPCDLGKWGNPGGGIDKSDLDHIQALSRELSEEFGAEIIGQIEIGPKLHINHRPDRTDHFYFVRFFGSSISPQVPDEIMNFGWFTVEEAAGLRLFFGFEAELAAEAARVRSNSGGHSRMLY
ncbi:MAG: NUDIX hydrolase [Bdellovibrionales bacterium]|nr:NUDIX hydrolase [Bdellovibrionales bacterium]